MRMSTQFRQPFLTIALSLLPCLLAPVAHAQLSGSMGLLSNYMYRGVSLSDDKAVARLALNYDGPSGWYGGGQVVPGQLGVEDHRHAQWTGYAGYSQRLQSGLSWETGGAAYAFSGTPSWNFHEFYIGLDGESISGRLHYAPQYLGTFDRTLYVEVNGGWALAPRLQAFWHGGYVYSRDNSKSRRPEMRIGLLTSHQGWQAQVSLDITRLRNGTKTDVHGATTDGSNEWRHEIVLAVVRNF